jgi:hypothetical protein
MPLRLDKNSPYPEAKEYLNDLEKRMGQLSPDEQNKIKQLCRLIIGPEMTASLAESSTEPMPTMSRSRSNENLTETKFIQTGIHSALEILKSSAKDAGPEEKRELGKNLKKLSQAYKHDSALKTAEPYLDLPVNEEDFASLKTVEDMLPDHLSQKTGKIVELTANIASCTVNVKNGRDQETGQKHLTTSYQEVHASTEQFLKELTDFSSDLNRISNSAIQLVEIAIKKIEEKQQQLQKFSLPLAIERANLDVQKNAGRKLSISERMRLLGNQSDKHPPVKVAPISADDSFLEINERNLTEHFNALNGVLSSCDELLKGPQRKQMGRLLADRHLINEELGEIRGLQKKFDSTERKYPEAQTELQNVINDLSSFLGPLKAFQQSLTNGLKQRNEALNGMRQKVQNTFKDLYQASQGLQSSLPACNIELKTL